MSNNFDLVKKGYDPVAVDDYIKRTDDYIKRLEMAVKGYKDKETSINNAIINAQVSADNISQNARISAEGVIHNAEKQARTLMEMSERHLLNIIHSLPAHKQVLQDFQREYNGVLERYLRKIVDSDFDALNGKIDALEEALRRLMPRQ